MNQQEKKEELLRALGNLEHSTDHEAAHVTADELLLEYIDDLSIRDAYDKIEKWYA